VFALVGVSVLSALAGTNFATNFSAPNTESTRAADLLRANFKAQSGDAVQVVMKGSPSMHDPAVRQQVTEFIAALEHVPHVASVSDPYSTPGRSRSPAPSRWQTRSSIRRRRTFPTRSASR
jgi:RND superfamily putative drug exporter